MSTKLLVVAWVGEDELRMDAQGVEDPGAHLGVEGAGCHPALRAPQHVRTDLLVAVGVPDARQLRHQLGRPRPGARQAERFEAAAQRLVGELAEPVRRLHQVAVGVEDRSVHGGPPQFQVVRPA